MACRTGAPKDKNESPEERKAKERLAQAQEKTKHKGFALNVKVANQVLAKLPAPIAYLKQIADARMFSDVSASLREQLTDALSRFAGFMDDAQAVVDAGGSDGPGDLPEPKALADDVASARKSANLISTILATMAKA